MQIDTVENYITKYFNSMLTKSNYKELISNVSIKKLIKDSGYIKYISEFNKNIAIDFTGINTLNVSTMNVKELVNIFKTSVSNLQNKIISTKDIKVVELKQLSSYVNVYETTITHRLKEKQIEVDNPDTEYWQYVGPDDDKTRDICQIGLSQQYFTTQEKIDFNSSGIRWNCRHIFVPATKKEYFS